VTLGKCLQRGPLVARIVVDVHAGIGFATRHDEVDQRFERTFLVPAVAPRRRSPVATPKGDESLVAGVRTKEILEPVGDVVERIALHVEKNVALRGLRQQPEAARPVLFICGIDRQELVAVRVGIPRRERSPLLELQARLPCELLKGRALHLRRPGFRLAACQRRQRRNAGAAQAALLQPR